MDVSNILDGYENYTVKSFLNKSLKIGSTRNFEYVPIIFLNAWNYIYSNTPIFYYYFDMSSTPSFAYEYPERDAFFQMYSNRKTISKSKKYGISNFSDVALYDEESNLLYCYCRDIKTQEDVFVVKKEFYTSPKYTLVKRNFKKHIINKNPDTELIFVDSIEDLCLVKDIVPTFESFEEELEYGKMLEKRVREFYDNSI